MNMFFTIFGFIFISCWSIFSLYIYDYFPITKLTNFIVNANKKGIWNKINITVFPILIWSIIEITILSSNYNFIIAIITNIIISCAILYLINYSFDIIFNIQNKIINIIAIIIATLIGQIIEYMILTIPAIIKLNIWEIILGLGIIIGIYFWWKYIPPKTAFFGEKNN